MARYLNIAVLARNTSARNTGARMSWACHARARKVGIASGIALVGLALIATGFGFGIAPPHPAAAQGVVLVQGNACVSSCNSAHTQCRIATKGSASCDAQLQACLRPCIKK
jgi:hypothetical protein